MAKRTVNGVDYDIDGALNEVWDDVIDSLYITEEQLIGAYVDPDTRDPDGYTVDIIPLADYAEEVVEYNPDYANDYDPDGEGWRDDGGYDIGCLTAVAQATIVEDYAGVTQQHVFVVDDQVVIVSENFV